MTPIDCGKCEHQNPYYALYCARCGEEIGLSRFQKFGPYVALVLAVFGMMCLAISVEEVNVWNCQYVDDCDFTGWNLDEAVLTALMASGLATLIAPFVASFRSRRGRVGLLAMGLGVAGLAASSVYLMQYQELRALERAVETIHDGEKQSKGKYK